MPLGHLLNVINIFANAFKPQVFMAPSEPRPEFRPPERPNFPPGGDRFQVQHSSQGGPVFQQPPNFQSAPPPFGPPSPPFEPPPGFNGMSHFHSVGSEAQPGRQPKDSSNQRDSTKRQPVNDIRFLDRGPKDSQQGHRVGTRPNLKSTQRTTSSPRQRDGSNNAIVLQRTNNAQNGRETTVTMKPTENSPFPDLIQLPPRPVPIASDNSAFFDDFSRNPALFNQPQAQVNLPPPPLILETNSILPPENTFNPDGQFSGLPAGADLNAPIPKPLLDPMLLDAPSQPSLIVPPLLPNKRRRRDITVGTTTLRSNERIVIPAEPLALGKPLIPSFMRKTSLKTGKESKSNITKKTTSINGTERLKTTKKPIQKTSRPKRTPGLAFLTDTYNAIVAFFYPTSEETQTRSSAYTTQRPQYYVHPHYVNLPSGYSVSHQYQQFAQPARVMNVLPQVAYGIPQNQVPVRNYQLPNPITSSPNPRFATFQGSGSPSPFVGHQGPVSYFQDRGLGGVTLTHEAPGPNSVEVQDVAEPRETPEVDSSEPSADSTRDDDSFRPQESTETSPLFTANILTFSNSGDHPRPDGEMAENNSNLMSDVEGNPNEPISDNASVNELEDDVTLSQESASPQENSASASSQDATEETPERLVASLPFFHALPSGVLIDSEGNEAIENKLTTETEADLASQDEADRSAPATELSPSKPSMPNLFHLIGRFAETEVTDISDVVTSSVDIKSSDTELPADETTETIQKEATSTPSNVSVEHRDPLAPHLGLLEAPILNFCLNRKFHTTYQNHGYMFSWDDLNMKNTRIPWLDATNFCRRQCMDLVSLETWMESQLILKKMEEDEVQAAWTSGHLCGFSSCDQPEVAKNWFWMGTQEKLELSNGWLEGQPDDHMGRIGGGREACVAVEVQNSSRGWSDFHCLKSLPFICEDSTELLTSVGLLR